MFETLGSETEYMAQIERLVRLCTKTQNLTADNADQADLHGSTIPFFKIRVIRVEIAFG
ncbi:MAG: hypothetical protein WCG81_21630 [Candidatus Angelobacter sp.]